MPPYNPSYLTTELEGLRPVLVSSRDARGLLLFDEFLREHEFGLALHVVCDYLVEPDSDAVGSATIVKIDELHSAMKIEDDCVERLIKKQMGSGV